MPPIRKPLWCSEIVFIIFIQATYLNKEIAMPKENSNNIGSDSMFHDNHVTGVDVWKPSSYFISNLLLIFIKPSNYNY